MRCHREIRAGRRAVRLALVALLAAIVAGIIVLPQQSGAAAPYVSFKAVGQAASNAVLGKLG